jgi:hypothetical protein
MLPRTPEWKPTAASMLISVSFTVRRGGGVGLLAARGSRPGQRLSSAAPEVW